MSIAKETLGENFSAIKPYLKGVAWQMAFLNSNKGDGLFYALEDEDGLIESEDEGEDEDSSVYVLTPEMSDIEEVFEYTVLRSSQNAGSGSKPLQSITKAFEVNGESSENPKKVSFFREDASLAVFLLTNKGSSQQASTVINTVTEKLEHNRFIAYGFLVPSDDTTCTSPNTNAHLKVKQLIVSTEGLIGGFCDRSKEYIKTLDKMGEHIKKNLVEVDLSIQSEIPLFQENIIESTVDVVFDPVENKVDWNFDSESNKILLDMAPALGTKITITYSYTSSTDQEGEEDIDE